MTHSFALPRRDFLRAAALGGGIAATMPAWAQPISAGIVRPLPTLAGNDIALTIDRVSVRVDGKVSRAVGVNGTVPAPLIRLREGQRVRLRVDNRLNEESSIHWHGLLVPFAMDGVPGVSFPGIMPRSTFTYDFDVVQSGTYWYHSHSAYQEEDGLYGPIVIDPAGPDPVAFDREHVLVLSDHSPMPGAAIYSKLKQMGGGYFNHQRLTLSGLLAGRDLTAKERREWGMMQMDPADIADVTGSTYTYTINGHGPFDNWTGLFSAGERVRLRIINAAAQTNFNVRIPGLAMTVVAADGLNVRPVAVDEFQIGVAETYDVIVTPGDRAYTIVSESIDRSGLGRATLAPRAGMSAPVPPLRPRPLLTMRDMGMGGMDHGAMAVGETPAPELARGPDPSAEQNASRNLARLSGWAGPATTSGVGTTNPVDHAAMDHAAMGHGATASTPAMDHGAGGMSHDMRDLSKAPGVRDDPGVQTISPMPIDRTGEPPVGLEGLGHRVLVYRDLMALTPNPDVRAPSRSLDIHLTGNMERYMWSFDGVKMSEPADPIPFRLNERVRVNLINDTMMPHPIHLHGHFFELVTGHGANAPRKHTVNVPPGGKMSFDLTADAIGDWAFHCHNLYHMTAGMMRVVTVRGGEGAGQ
ncbi:copper resistance system multicopper oxidase [Sphingomonas sp. LY160]|uniref:copper resistance system multicopper oxidase n=1 Tax=Sphingomonas sp. LY160 TaxID=3095342 RepID=UPI002ADEC217|nr:copper resistance system multicopper oxidase [Sphingomonas sp. LY160]MEA1070974.1 copper resistance system multicopper oxidase [Sphingomonas sp. LY160]